MVVGFHLLVKTGDSVAFHDFRKSRMTDPRHVVRMEPAPLPELKSLRGTSFAVFGAAGSGPAMEIWAKGDHYRAEVVLDDGQVIVIQRGDANYVSDERQQTWERQQLPPGLTAMGLVRQVADVKANGRRQGAEVIDGILHYQFYYGPGRAPREGDRLHLIHHLVAKNLDQHGEAG